MSALPELAQIEAELGRRSLHDYAQIVWPLVEPSVPFVDSWHIGLLCEHYEACARGEIDRLVVNLPPGCTKSKMTCVIFPTWEWARSPESAATRWLFGSFDQGLCNRDAADSVALMQDPWFKQRWGLSFSLPKVCPIEKIENSATGFRIGTTPGGRGTGWHVHYQVIDDPTKPMECTKHNLELAQAWLSGTLATRWVKPGRNCRILIMQRLHTNDLAAAMLAEGAVHISLPMRFEPTVRCQTKWGADPRTEDGELLCPARFSDAAVAKIEKDLGGMNAAAQLQQRPVPEGGAIFKAEHLRKYWKVLPARWDQLVMSVDCSFKDVHTSDFVSIQVWGRIGAEFYLVYRRKARMGFAATCEAIRSTKRLMPRIHGILVEDKANGSAVIETLQKDIPGIVPVTPEGGKDARAWAVEPLFEAGNVWLPDPEMPGFEWLDIEYRPELLAFPMGRNDDDVDATTQALNYLHQKQTYLKEAMAKAKEAGMLK